MKNFFPKKTTTVLTVLLISSIEAQACFFGFFCSGQNDINYPIIDKPFIDPKPPVSYPQPPVVLIPQPPIIDPRPPVVVPPKPPKPPRPVNKVGSIGDRVWADNNQNGIQDFNEQGVPNIKVTLFKENGRKVITKQTNTNGRYQFKNIPFGRYYIRFNVPANHHVSPKHTGYNLYTDSDARVHGKTKVFTLKSRHHHSMDMGLIGNRNAD